jgi:hypothetical protein
MNSEHVGMLVARRMQQAIEALERILSPGLAVEER